MTRFVDAAHVRAGMTLVHHTTRQEYEVLQNVGVNRVLVVKGADGEIYKVPYDDYQQPVEVT